MRLAARLGIPTEPGGRFWRLTPADLTRERDAHEEAQLDAGRDAWHRAAFVVCAVYNVQRGKETDPVFDPSDFLPWLPKPETDVGANPITAENVTDRFRAALERAGHTVPAHA